MRSSSKPAFALLVLALALTPGCSESSENPDGGGGGGGDAPSASGGAPSASGGAPGTGGVPSSSGGAPSGSGGGTPTSSVGDLMSEQQFNSIFPNRASLYTYQGFLAATGHPLLNDFAATGTDEQRRRELAAFFANIAHETTGGWPDAPGGKEAWGLYFIEEQGCQGGGCPGYCVWTDPNNPPPEGHHPCAPGKSYHGRGPIQISYNFNYGQAAAALNEPILAQPELVATDSKITFETALWFWMSGKSGGELTCHDVMKQGLGFGQTIRIINGIECNGGGWEKVESRVAHYEKFCELLGVSPGDNLRC